VIGDGVLSAASANIRAASVPNAPGTPFMVSANTNAIMIQWTAPTYNGGNAITNYSVYISTSVNGPFTLY
jgi:hypothetical protein